MANANVGGSFAPPIDKAKLAKYKLLAAGASLPVKDAMDTLATMLEKFWETPESTLEGTAHPAGVGIIVPLEEGEVQRIWDFVPWEHELNAYGTVFEKLPRGELRNAAFHLLWYGRELCMDREPITNDKL